MRRTRLLPLAISLLSAPLPPAAAQEEAQPPPAGQFEERIEVGEALVDALVTDRRGNVVLGLGPADFRVTVDGRPAEVTAATFYSNRRFLAASGAKPPGLGEPAAPDRRYFVLFFDDQRTEAHENPPLLSRQLEAGRAAERWLREELLPNDLVAVAAFTSRLELQQDFTNDLDALVRAVGRASRGGAAPAAWPSRAPTAGGDTPALAAALPAGDQLRDRTPEIHRALTVLAEASAGIPARKNLVLFTSGFGDVDALGFYQPDARYDRALVEALNAANLAVYAVDLVPTGTRHPFEHFFTRIAGLTGGTAFLDVVQFGVPLARVARETNGYYLVAVRLRGADAAAGYRRVEVAVANPELEVRTRSGLRFGAGG